MVLKSELIESLVKTLQLMDAKIQVILSLLNPDLHDLIVRVYRTIFSMLYET